MDDETWRHPDGGLVRSVHGTGRLLPPPPIHHGAQDQEFCQRHLRYGAGTGTGTVPRPEAVSSVPK